MADTILELDQIEKSFGDTEVLRGISLSIDRGEFITFLGPSGCGKTTTLRIIAGLESPDRGRVRLEGQDVTDLEPNRRSVNTVFQNYALFPHMNVYANVAYGLKLKKIPKKEIEERVTAVLELVQLGGYEKRMPSELSGGQKQRVAIARAVVNNPKVLLLDEPLGALDLQLRRQMQVELKRLQKQLGITFIYITHDQEEAINMSDRIVVMRDGRFEQIGTPDEVYDFPKTSYVAGFVGTANIIKGTLRGLSGGIAQVKTAAGLVSATVGAPELAAQSLGTVLKPGDPVTLAVRSEHIALRKALKEEEPAAGAGAPKREPAAGAGAPEREPAAGAGVPEEESRGQAPEEGLKLRVAEKSYAGGMMRIVLDGGPLGELISRSQRSSLIREGDTVYGTWEPDQAVLVDLEVPAE